MWLRCSRGYHWYELMRYNNELIDVYDIALLYNNINKSFTYNLTSIENIHLNMLKNKSFRDNIMSQISANMVEENKIKTSKSNPFIKILIQTYSRGIIIPVYNETINQDFNILMDWHNQNDRIYFDIDSSNKTKQYEQLLQIAANNMLINSKNGIIDFIKITGTTNISYTEDINANITNLLFMNNRTMIHIMTKTYLWKCIIDTLFVLLTANDIPGFRIMKLIKIYCKTIPFWTTKVILYIQSKKLFVEALLYAMVNAFCRGSSHQCMKMKKIMHR